MLSSGIVSGSLDAAQGAALFVCGLAAAAGGAGGAVACSNYQAGTVTLVCSASPCGFAGVGTTGDTLGPGGTTVATCGLAVAGAASAPSAGGIRCASAPGPLSSTVNASAPASPAGPAPTAAVPDSMASTGLPLLAGAVGMLLVVAGLVVARRHTAD